MGHRLAAVLMADVVGYSRLMEADEAGTHAALKERRVSVLEPTVRANGGRVVKVMGDGVLIEFGSAVNAVTGAVDWACASASNATAAARGMATGIVPPTNPIPVKFVPSECR